MLRAQNISKTVGGRKILDDICITLKPEEIICIIGPSGAGKTSLLRALSLVNPPDSGSLQIDDRQYHFPVRTEVEKGTPYPKLTVVFQQFFVWPHLTIRGNLLLPLRNFDEKHFEEIVRLFRMVDFLDRYPNEVSMGERQRTALARALLLKPRYLLLDEVTSALDIEQAHLILSHLKQIAKRGVGIIFVTHALHFARTISDEVLFLDEGRVVESGNATILTHPKSDRLKNFVNIFQEIA